MDQSLQVIHVEDSTADCELIESLLLNGGLQCEFKRVEDRDGFIAALQESPLHLILSDCTLPQFHGLEALKIAREMRPEIPFIFISGTIGEETAVESLQQGATDYILKQGLARLIPAVRRALAEAESRNTRASSRPSARCSAASPMTSVTSSRSSSSSSTCCPWSPMSRNRFAALPWN
jgi:DNA-binding NtrC family response regulator